MQDISDSNFENEVINSDVPVLIDFWAEWCGPCKSFLPTLEAVSQDMSGEIKVVKMNIDQNTQTPSELGVRSIPTLMLYKGGKQLGIKVGSVPKEELIKWIRSLI